MKPQYPPNPRSLAAEKNALPQRQTVLKQHRCPTVRPTPWLEARRAGRSWQTVVVHVACVASVVKNRVSLPETVWLMNQILVATTHHLGAGPYRPQIGKLLLDRKSVV